MLSNSMSNELCIFTNHTHVQSKASRRTYMSPSEKPYYPIIFKLATSLVISYSNLVGIYYVCIVSKIYMIYVQSCIAFSGATFTYDCGRGTISLEVLENVSSHTHHVFLQVEAPLCGYIAHHDTQS